MKVSEDELAAGFQHTIHVVDEFDDEIVVEVVDEADAVDQVLRREVQVLPAGREIDQIGVDGADVALAFELLGLVAHEGQRLKIDVDERRFQIVGIVERFEGVEDLLRRPACETGDKSPFLGALLDGTLDFVRKQAATVADGLGGRLVQETLLSLAHGDSVALSQSRVLHSSDGFAFSCGQLGVA